MTNNGSIKWGVFLYKKVSIYNTDGEEVHAHTSEFKGRFRENGYLMYAHGQTISRRTNLKFPESMTKIDMANMDLLSAHLLPNLNVIGYRTKKGNEPMTAKQIGKVIGIEERQTRRFIKKMIEVRMMAKDGEQYVVNPLYFLNGKVITDYMYWLFEDHLNEYMTEWVRKTYRERKGFN